MFQISPSLHLAILSVVLPVASPALGQAQTAPLRAGIPSAPGQIRATVAVTRPAPRSTASRVGREIGVWIGILGAGVGSAASGDPSALTCGPCDRETVPVFDRWAITGARDEFDLLSTGTLVATAGVAWLHTTTRGRGFAHLGASVESAALAVAVTQLLKHATERRRPYTYTRGTLTDAEIRDAKRSWPSGHTSAAFAVATSHWLSERGGNYSATRMIVGGAAVLTGILRVPAGRHFPSDVVSGAGLGVASALLVHTIRF